MNLNIFYFFFYNPDVFIENKKAPAPEDNKPPLLRFQQIYEEVKKRMNIEPFEIFGKSAISERSLITTHREKICC